MDEGELGSSWFGLPTHSRKNPSMLLFFTILHYSLVLQFTIQYNTFESIVILYQFKVWESLFDFQQHLCGETTYNKINK